MTSKESYPAIESLGAIGDRRTVALIGPDGAVEWFCPRRFDEPPLVWPLLDRVNGGRLRVAPAAPADTSIQYVDETAVLQLRWETDAGEAVGHIFMPWDGDGTTIVWNIEATRGRVAIEIDCDLRDGFEPEPLPKKRGANSATFGTNDEVALVSSVPFSDGGDGLRFDLVEAEAATLHLQVGGDASSPGNEQGEVQSTIQAWKSWTREAVTYSGPYRDAVVRSAITLKLLIYEPSGAIVAAPTTSLPEEIGGVRNWDYRYTWLRDASFTVNALYQLGCTREARRYGEWMCRTTMIHGLPLRVFYGVDGSTEYPERDIDFADGYQGSRPVRVGNGAEAQMQLDSYGELLDCVTICELMGDEVVRGDWAHFRSLVDFVADHWREPDSGIWEVRDDPRHFTQSKALAWVALDRGTHLARELGLEADTERWADEAKALRDQVFSNAVIEERDCFGRSYGEDVPDASLLTLPLVGFVDGDDPLMMNTIELVRGALAPEDSVVAGLLYRYRPEAGDGLSGQEGAFTICSFWLVQALCAGARREEARSIFEDVLDLQGGLGLWAEEVDPASGQQLGNFPQAFSHIGLINAAVALSQDATTGRSATYGPSDGR